MERKKFFLICLVGGICFAVPFFFGFGSTIGYPWYWTLICLGVGLLFSITFYFVWIIAEKFQKPHSFENPKAQSKLSDYEAIRNTSYECKFSAHMHYGKGLKQEICETCIYFETTGLHIAFCHLGEIYFFDVAYEVIQSAFIANENVLVLNASDIGSLAFRIKNLTPQLQELLFEKGIHEEAFSE